MKRKVSKRAIGATKGKTQRKVSSVKRKVAKKTSQRNRLEDFIKIVPVGY